MYLYRGGDGYEDNLRRGALHGAQTGIDTSVLLPLGTVNVPLHWNPLRRLVGLHVLHRLSKGHETDVCFDGRSNTLVQRDSLVLEKLFLFGEGHAGFRAY